ncbi:MAG TPA: methylated-DNA--[protein]-cysteine S-methyltransferase [Ramlibacter sp.]|jgi:methylated-DNA-[protein]-cysteine S-methyltransferase
MKTTTPLACQHYESPMGTMLLAATDRGLAGLWFVGQRHGPAAPPGPEVADHPVLAEAVRQLRAYFAGERSSFALPLDFAWGTPFQQSVWQALLAIPSGQTTSYGELGRRVGRPQAARAIGAAVGRNPVSIVVPCHRVLGTAGALTGYAGGIERKTALLKLEGALV